MTVSPVRFGWAYMVQGNAADRQSAWQAADAEAQQMSMDIDVLQDADTDLDLYVTEGDVAKFQQNRTEIDKFFAIRRDLLEDAKKAIQAALRKGGSVTQADKDSLAQYQGVIANDRLTPPLTALKDLWDIDVDPYTQLQGAVIPADDVTNGFIDLSTGN